MNEITEKTGEKTDQKFKEEELRNKKEEDDNVKVEGPWIKGDTMFQCRQTMS